MSTEIVTPDSGAPGTPHQPFVTRGRATVLGLVAVALTVAVAELIAALGSWLGLLGGPSSPVQSLGGAVIAISPGWLVEWAKQTLGAPGDKIFLGIGIAVIALAFGGGVGLLARRRLWPAIAAASVLVVVTAVAVLGREDAMVLDLIPLLVGAAVGIRYLVACFGPRGWAHSTDHVSGPATGRTTASRQSSEVRRQFLRLAGWGVVGAVLTGGISRLLPTDAAAVASRAGVVLPPITRRTTSAARTTAGTTASSTASSTAGSSSSAGSTASSTTGTTRSSGPGLATLDDIPGLTRYVVPNTDFYRIDTSFVVPSVTTAEWKLRIHGMVEKEITIDFADLTARDQIERMITLSCVSNPRGGDLIGNALWQGTLISALLAEAKPLKNADCVLSSDVGGFTSSTPLEALTDDRDALLAIGMNGEPLPLEHGFPVRMVVPGLYGYVSATKWVVDWEVTRFDKVSAYWTGLGWSERGPIKTQSRIDVPANSVSAGTVPVAGVAWAPHKGIKGVQVQIDNGSGWGAWQTAKVSRPISVDTWVQWEFRWDATPGDYKIRCRAIDLTDYIQSGTDSDVLPDGATGYHQISLTVTA